MSAGAKPGSKVRWAILALLFFSTVLNYVDRQTLSILATTIQADLGIDDIGYAHVVQLFLIAYTLAYFVVGWITDRLDSKLALALFVGWWSIANMVTGLVHSAGQLGAARFALGLGEAGNYVAAPKAVSEHYAPHERGFAVGVYTAGAMVGATIAPPLIGWLALSYGWRTAFVATGALGFVWMAAWLVLRHGQPSQTAVGAAAEKPSIGAILSDKSVWGLALARTITDPVWYFYLFWFPKYLGDARGLPLAAIAATAWLVYLAADIGSVGGGLLSGRFVRRGAAPIASRLRVMGMGACLAPLGALIAFQPSLPVTYGLAALVALSHMMFLGNLTTLAVDRFPQARVATIFGLIAAGSGIGGIISTQLVGAFAATRDYGTVFLVMAALHPIGWLIARATAGKPVEARQ
ncbi:MFS transporter [Sphingomonas sp. BT-65]|uniref:MFS transporter n=1 Tax=Sphingomonas sp. BT-65 TaxID=2989821 RepID=UPI002235E885|nr:MFS transporter [Sphingomonas sp. BT-65]MCW4461190.1 MFS transporter [Sphingomonas sp. BT-65]